MCLPGNLVTKISSGTLCIMMVLCATSARSYFSSGINDVEKVAKKANIMCSKNMACRWALCPWSPKSTSSVPSDASCLIINNDSCECPGNHRCMLTDFIEPETQFVKFEYRCGNPDLTQEVYQVADQTAREK